MKKNKKSWDEKSPVERADELVEGVKVDSAFDYILPKVLHVGAVLLIIFVFCFTVFYIAKLCGCG